MKDPRKILILRFSSLGDLVMATPMIRCLRKRFPQSQIDMVVREDFLDIIKNNPHLNAKIGLSRDLGFRGLLALRRRINLEQYDLIYDAHFSLRTILMMPFLRASHKLRYQKHYLRRSVALLFKIPLLTQKRMLHSYLEPLSKWGVQFDGLGPEFLVSKETTKNFHPLLLSLPMVRKVGFIPSAQWSGKRWKPEYFRKLLAMMIERTADHFFILGGRNDTFCQVISDGFPRERVTNFQGRLSIEDSAAIIQHCSYVVANDTGMMHVADALGIPSVLILGPTSGELGCLPYHPKSRVVEVDLWCRPCSKNGQAPCIRGKRLCLDLIKPETVFQASLELRHALQ